MFRARRNGHRGTRRAWGPAHKHGSVRKHRTDCDPAQPPVRPFQHALLHLPRIALPIIDTAAATPLVISPERSSAVVASTKQGCMQLLKYSARASAWTGTWRRTVEEHLAALDARDANGSKLEEAHPLTHAMVDAATKDEAFASTMAAVPSLIG
jgi:hypothetical protein